MARKEIRSIFDRNNRNNLNDNFKELYEGIESASEWKTKSDEVLNEARNVNDMNVDVQKQLDSLILDSGTSDAEVVQARGSHTLLNERLNNIESNINATASNIESKIEAEWKVRTPVKYGKIEMPNDFITIDFNLYRGIDGKVVHDISLEERFRSNNIEKIIYTDLISGNNLTGDGSEGNPFKTPNKALEYATSISEKRIKIIVSAEELLRNEIGLIAGSTLEFIDKHIVITTQDNKVIPYINGDSTKRVSYNLVGGSSAKLPEWTIETGNVYKTTRSNTSYVTDINYRNPFTDKIMKMEKVTNIEDCESTKGSYYIDGATVYVHTFDSRVPDGEIVCVFLWTTPYLHFRLRNSTLFIENIEFFNYDGLTIRGDTSSQVIFNNCDFGETGTSNSLNILHVGKTYLLNCSTHDSYMDGFNYHYPTGVDNTECLVFEYDCFGYNNGNSGGTGNNYTTLHDGASIIRVNSVGENSEGVTCADVNGSYSVLVDCKMFNSKLDESNLRSSSYQFTTDGASKKAKALLINCSGTSPNWSILTDLHKGTMLELQSWHEGLDTIKGDTNL